MKRKIAAIDVGTTKVCTIMGILSSSSGLRILGTGIAPSYGIEKGIVEDVALAKESIRQSIKKAETVSGYKLESAYIGVNGKHISSMNNKAMPFSKTDQLVRPEDLKRVLDVALDIKTLADRQLLHVSPKARTHGGIAVRNPVHGYELDVEAQAVAQAVASVQNLTKCIQEVGIEIEDLVLESQATAEAVLTEEEKQSGVLIANIGGGTTDIAVMKDRSICHTSVLPVAGHQISMDIAAGLGISFDMAEEMKKTFGKVWTAEEEDADRTVELNGQTANYRDLCDIISIRVEELIHLMMLRMPDTDLMTLIPSGIVITGGSAQLPGMVELTQSITRLPVRIGEPATLNGITKALNDPAYATTVGLVLWKMKNDSSIDRKWMLAKPTGLRGLLSGIFAMFQ